MVVNEKALVRELKETYKGLGYTVMVLPDDKWVFKRQDCWMVEIEGQDNVPNEVLALIVLHMGKLPKEQSCQRIYKGEKCSIIQKEVYKVAEEDHHRWDKLRLGVEEEPEEARRTALVFGRRRIWQLTEEKQIMLIDPNFEGLMKRNGDSVVRRAGENIFLEGEISYVFISRARGGASENLLEHLAKVKWT